MAYNRETRRRLATWGDWEMRRGGDDEPKEKKIVEMTEWQWDEGKTEDLGRGYV